jgi:hypothetical protein
MADITLDPDDLESSRVAPSVASTATGSAWAWAALAPEAAAKNVNDDASTTAAPAATQVCLYSLCYNICLFRFRCPPDYVFFGHVRFPSLTSKVKISRCCPRLRNHGITVPYCSCSTCRANIGVRLSLAVCSTACIGAKCGASISATTASIIIIIASNCQGQVTRRRPSAP